MNNFPFLFLKHLLFLILNNQPKQKLNFHSIEYIIYSLCRLIITFLCSIILATDWLNSAIRRFNISIAPRKMMNMLDVRDVSTNLESSIDVNSLFLTHVLFIFLGAILMLNLLIALFSQSVAKIMEHKTVIINLQRLYIIYSMEWKLSFCLGWLFKIRKRSCFKHKDGKLFITAGSVKNYFRKGNMSFTSNWPLAMVMLWWLWLQTV